MVLGNGVMLGACARETALKASTAQRAKMMAFIGSLLRTEAY
jgi:hypothetical protein